MHFKTRNGITITSALGIGKMIHLYFRDENDTYQLDLDLSEFVDLNSKFVELADFASTTKCPWTEQDD